MKSLLSIAIIFFLSVLSFVGCQQEEVPVEDTGTVEATDAYLKYYGVPPQGKAGRAYAAVGYLPTKDNPEKIGPLPIFLFTEENQMEKVLKKLVSGDLVTSQKQIYYNPFPSDLKMRIKSDEGNLLTINLLTNESWQKDDEISGISALKGTALQFSHVENVKVMLNGAFVQGMPRQGFQKDSDLIIEVPPPILILMAGAWEKGQNEPEEILVEFDRPVKIEKFKLYHLDGQEVRGEYYKSIFQMAVVIHPESPSLFSEDTTLRAEWSVVDELGRNNSGIDSMQLFKYEH